MKRLRFGRKGFREVLEGSGRFQPERKVPESFQRVPAKEEGSGMVPKTSFGAVTKLCPS
jgi:hypothetical protein